MLRRLYDWTLSLSARPGALWALAIVSFVESSIFPIPPDVLIIPMVLAARQRAWAIAGVATIASVLGGFAGYAIGYFLFQEIGQCIEHARRAGVSETWIESISAAMTRITEVTGQIGTRAIKDPNQGLQTSVDYLDLVSTTAIGWQWLKMAAVASEGLQGGAAVDADFYRGKLRAAPYWFHNEMPRTATLAKVIVEADDAFRTMEEAWF